MPCEFKASGWNFASLAFLAEHSQHRAAVSLALSSSEATKAGGVLLTPGDSDIPWSITAGKTEKQRYSVALWPTPFTEVGMPRLNRRAQSATTSSRFISGGAPSHGTDQCTLLSGASTIAGTPTGTPRWRASRRAKRKARIVYNDCAFPAKEGGKAAFLAGQ